MKNNLNSKDNRYSLFAFIIHYGKHLTRGHYISIIQRNDKWYECNDNLITELNAFTEDGYIIFDKVDKETMNKNGYLFFYRKISC